MFFDLFPRGTSLWRLPVYPSGEKAEEYQESQVGRGMVLGTEGLSAIPARGGALVGWLLGSWW